jgi:hypothetical protein
MYYYLWALPSCVIFFLIISKLVVVNNELKTPQTFIIYSIVRALPLLPLISIVSKRIVFDCMAYDVLMFIVCAIALGIFSKTGFRAMTITNVIGFCMVLIGFTLMNLKV